MFLLTITFVPMSESICISVTQYTGVGIELQQAFSSFRERFSPSVSIHPCNIVWNEIQSPRVQHLVQLVFLKNIYRFLLLLENSWSNKYGSNEQVTTAWQRMQWVLWVLNKKMSVFLFLSSKIRPDEDKSILWNEKFHLCMIPDFAGLFISLIISLLQRPRLENQCFLLYPGYSCVPFQVLHSLKSPLKPNTVCHNGSKLQKLL